AGGSRARAALSPARAARLRGAFGRAAGQPRRPAVSGFVSESTAFAASGPNRALDRSGVDGEPEGSRREQNDRANPALRGRAGTVLGIETGPFTWHDAKWRKRVRWSEQVLSTFP